MPENDENGKDKRTEELLRAIRLAFAKEDNAEVFRLLQAPELSDSPDAAFLLGNYYKDIVTDREKAITAYRRAVFLGSVKAWSPLGILLTETKDWHEYMEGRRFLMRAARELEDIPAQYRLGWYCLYGRTGESEPQSAIYWFSLAAERGHPESIYSLILLFINEKYVPRDIDRALTYIRRLLEIGRADAAIEFGLFLYFGEDMRRDVADALRILEPISSAGSAQASARIGYIYLFGADGVRTDLKKALRYIRQAARSGEPYGEELLGYCYFHGIGVEKDTVKGLQLFRKTADAGWMGGQYQLGMYYAYWTNPHQFKKAAYWFSLAAEQNHTDALVKLGFLYRYGFGVEKNQEKAFESFRRAASRGDKTAMHHLGDAYERGLGVEKDDTRALSWYLMAAERGEPLGMFAAGKMIWNGVGHVKDKAGGVEWIRRAAAKELPDATEWLLRHEGK